MTVYLYTGKLSDFSVTAFPHAVPTLWVSPEHSAFGPDGGVHAGRRIPIVLRTDGTFEVSLVASADLTPETNYSLRCEWVNADGVPLGWEQWDFTAAIGGGPISDMAGVIVTRVWLGETPPPVSRAGIYWVNPVTGDVKEWM